MSDFGRYDDRSSFQQLVESVDGDLEEYHGEEYVIRGLQLDDGFGIGLSYAGDGAPPNDIVPLEVYQPVEEKIRSMIAIEEVQRRTSPDVWPQLGTCRLFVRDDDSVKVDIEIRDLGVIGV